MHRLTLRSLLPLAAVLSVVGWASPAAAADEVIVVNGCADLNATFVGDEAGGHCECDAGFVASFDDDGIVCTEYQWGSVIGGAFAGLCGLMPDFCGADPSGGGSGSGSGENKGCEFQCLVEEYACLDEVAEEEESCLSTADRVYLNCMFWTADQCDPWPADQRDQCVAGWTEGCGSQHDDQREGCASRAREREGGCDSHAAVCERTCTESGNDPTAGTPGSGLAAPSFELTQTGVVFTAPIATPLLTSPAPESVEPVAPEQTCEGCALYALTGTARIKLRRMGRGLEPVAMGLRLGDGYFQAVDAHGLPLAGEATAHRRGTKLGLAIAPEFEKSLELLVAGAQRETIGVEASNVTTGAPTFRAKLKANGKLGAKLVVPFSVEIDGVPHPGRYVARLRGGAR